MEISRRPLPTGTGWPISPPPPYGISAPSPPLPPPPPPPPMPVDPPHRPQLRPSRSTTYLRNISQRPRTRDASSKPPPLPDGFINENVLHASYPLPPPPPSPSPSEAAAPPIRRVKSSSALQAVSPNAAGAKGPTKLKKAFEDAQWAVGGLISRPAVSSKRFSIIRHSHGLVWYRGPTTSLSITILSDEPLPPTRTVWLQEKGYSGSMGMGLKALVGSNGSWLEVTPARQARPEHLVESKERAIQRDLKRFAKKASGSAAKHRPRETLVVRIPAAAADGYFRLVLCAGEGSKKVLCGSPPFRIASTSADMAVVRGASLTTMPLEMGVKVASTIGQQVAKKYAGVAGAVVQSRAKRVVIGATAKKAGQTALRGYQTVGVGAAVSESWDRSKAGAYDPLLADPANATVGIIGSDDGPEAPFPLKFEGKVIPGTGASMSDLCIPTANLSEVPQDIKARLHGVYAAWVRIIPEKGLECASLDWHESIVTVAPLWNAVPGVTMKNRVIVHMIHDFEGVEFFGTRLKVLLVGFLHPPALVDADLASLVNMHAEDAMTTVSSLGREAWAAEEVVAKMKGLKSSRTFTNRLDGATGRVVQQVDRIPLHLAGVRSDSDVSRDAMHGIGGMWIPR